MTLPTIHIPTASKFPARHPCARGVEVLRRSIGPVVAGAEAGEATGHPDLRMARHMLTKNDHPVVTKNVTFIYVKMRIE